MAAVFAGTVTTFCKSLQWNLLALILAQFRERLFFGIHPDLIDLMKVPSMNSTRLARALYKNGIEKLSDLANSKALAVETVLMDLGQNFLVVGKSVDMSVKDLAKLLISDARSHIQNEIGLRELKWNEESNVEPEEAPETAAASTQKSDPAEKSKEIFKAPDPEPATPGNKRKRKIGDAFTSSEPTDATVDVQEKIPKKAKTDQNKSVEYRRKLRSSGGGDDFVSITQFMNELDKKAEANENLPLEVSDPNASLFNEAELEISSADDLLEQTRRHLEIIDVLADEKGFASFIKEFARQSAAGMSLGISKFEVKSETIGGKLLKQQTQIEHNFVFENNCFIDCISFCFDSNRVFYVNLQTKDAVLSKVKKLLMHIIGRSDLTLRAYEGREHLKLLLKVLGPVSNIFVKIHDPRVGSWLLDPDTNLSWQEMIQKYTPDHIDILQLATKQSQVSSLGLCHVNRVDPKIRTAVECFLSKELVAQQLELLKVIGKNSLVRVFNDLEMPIQVALMKMELTGFPINEDRLRQMIEDTTALQRQLEQHIYELNGRKFNLHSSKEVSMVVGIHRNLEKKKKVSTAKNVLEKLDLPIASAIMTWRTLAKTISNIQPMTKLAKDGRIFGNSFSLTQTGRISMYEPNLQNVTKDFIVEFKGK